MRFLINLIKLLGITLLYSLNLKLAIICLSIDIVITTILFIINIIMMGACMDGDINRIIEYRKNTFENLKCNFIYLILLLILLLIFYFNLNIVYMQSVLLLSLVLLGIRKTLSFFKQTKDFI